MGTIEGSLSGACQQALLQLVLGTINTSRSFDIIRRAEKQLLNERFTPKYTIEISSWQSNNVLIS